MNDLNKVFLIGNLTKEPEVKTTTTGKQVASFTIATNKSYKGKDGNKIESAEYHSIIAWGNLAGIIQNYVHKGDKIFIEGELQTRSWDDQQGNKKFKTEVIMTNLQMLGGRKGGEQKEEVQTMKVEDNTEYVDIKNIPF
jgi:single-strand DNA-binding protein